MQRVGPLLNERVETLGQVAILKQGWPELFHRLADIYPQILGMT